MTVSELYRQVAGLGFESSLESDERFTEAANRALLQVSDVRPAVRYYTINHKPLENKIYNIVDTFTPIEVNGELSFSAIDGKAYYFEADGNGVAHIEHVADGVVTLIKSIPLASNRAFVAHRGLIKKDGNFVSGIVRIRFAGEYTYSVRNVAIYDRIYSGDERDVPAYEPYTRYDISKCVDDFLALEAPPITDDAAHYVLNQDYFIENGRVILLPYDKAGCYKVVYKHRPERIGDDAESSNQEVDLDPDLAELMPLAIAIYVWAEDEADLVNHYAEQYQRRVQEIVSRTRNYAPIKITTNGW